MGTKQHFGGAWTVEKLGILSDYLNAYATALKNKSFKLLYIDAFAGTGQIRIGDEEKYEEIDGSAKLALMAREHFSEYIFIEKKRTFAAELRARVDNEFPELKDRVTIYREDCNDVLTKLCANEDWRTTRAVVFLDPYASEVKWETLEALAATQAIDVWYLFPFSTATRMMKKRGEIDPTWRAKLDSIFGDNSWETDLYHEDNQISMFDDEPAMVRDNDSQALKAYIEKRLRSVFPRVSDHSRILYNSRRSPFFLFCFAVSSKSEAAQNLALKIADHILKKQISGT